MAAGAAAIGDGDALAASVKIHSSTMAVRRAEDIHKVYPIKKILAEDILIVLLRVTHSGHNILLDQAVNRIVIV